MQKSFVLLQFLISAGLMAQNVVAAKTVPETKPDTCSIKATASNPSPCFERGDQALAGTLVAGNPPTAGYNYPGNISLSDGWDVHADVSYLFWYTKQEGLDLATLGHIYIDELWEPATQGGKVLFQDTKYSSGFKVGLGANLNADDWAIDLVYTYLHQETHTNSGNATAPAGQVPAFNVSGWFQNNYYGGQDIVNNFTSKWKMDLDWLDLEFTRPFYQGRAFVLTPNVGLRASWIRQKLNISSPNLRNSYEFNAPVSGTSKNDSKSWAIGPRALLDMRWLVGAGFRFQGNIGGSLLFTQYTHVSHHETSLETPASTGGVDVNFRDYNCLRPMAEANLGIGWGTYLNQKKSHIDLSATYDFNYLWSQNMMRYLLVSSSVFSGGGSPGDLLLHGLEINARFDF